jgi:hypothetical protein
MFGWRRWLIGKADAVAQDRVRVLERENRRLQDEVDVQRDMIKRLTEWQGRETERLEKETAIFTADKVRALEFSRGGFAGGDNDR